MDFCKLCIHHFATFKSCSFIIKAAPPTHLHAAQLCMSQKEVLLDAQTKIADSRMSTNTDKTLRSPEPGVTDMLSGSTNFHATTDSVSVRVDFWFSPNVW